MRHRVKSRTLGRPQAHRLSMLRNLTRSLLKHRRITTTETRARELASFVEKIITEAKKAHAAGDPAKKLAHKRQVFRHFSTQTSNAERRKRGLKKTKPHRDLAQELFDLIAPQYANRDGGYTRIVRLYPRKGDGAPMALIELVEG